MLKSGLSLSLEVFKIFIRTGSTALHQTIASYCPSRNKREERRHVCPPRWIRTHDTSVLETPRAGGSQKAEVSTVYVMFARLSVELVLVLATAVPSSSIRIFVLWQRQVAHVGILCSLMCGLSKTGSNYTP